MSEKAPETPKIPRPGAGKPAPEFLSGAERPGASKPAPEFLSGAERPGASKPAPEFLSGAERPGARQQKRATALRENLLKRKTQSRERQKQEKE